VPRGAKSRMRRTETPKPIWIKFCMVVDIPDVVTYANFSDHRLRGFWGAGRQISPSPIDFDRPYNTLALPCSVWCYQCVWLTSDVHSVCYYCISFCTLVDMAYVMCLVLLHNLIVSSLLLLYSKMKIFYSKKGNIVTIWKFWSFRATF